MKNNIMKNRGEIIKTILIIIGICIFVCGLIYTAYDDYKTKKEYGEIIYEFVITDKFDDLGSNWHLVGGRATEQEYHIIYKYRLTNRPKLDDNMVWYSGETTVSGSRYRELYIGQTLYDNTSLFPY
jgi:hypothetical protein